MKRKEFSEFIGSHRDLFAMEANNIFAFSWAKVSMRWEYLEIILSRFSDASSAFVKNSEEFRSSLKSGNQMLSESQITTQMEGVRIGTRAYLEVDSFYLFAKIMLDNVTHAIEHYFGPVRGLALDSHDNLAKQIVKFAELKRLQLPDGFVEKAQHLKMQVSDFRDTQIAHEKSPRTTRAFSWDIGGKVRVVITRLYPKKTDPQNESEDIEVMFGEVESYMGLVAELLVKNVDRAAPERA